MPDAFVIAGQSNFVRNAANLESALKAEYGADTLAIKAAVGGTSISQWQRTATPYENAVTATQLAIAQGYNVRAILNFSGEKDAKQYPGYSAQWAELFEQFVTHFGADVGHANLPVVYAQLGQAPSPAPAWPYWQTVKAQQASLVPGHTNWRMVSTQTIAPYAPNDAPHYYDDIADPSWAGTGYALITARFINNVKQVAP